MCKIANLAAVAIVRLISAFGRPVDYAGYVAACKRYRKRPMRDARFERVRVSAAGVRAAAWLTGHGVGQWCSIMELLAK